MKEKKERLKLSLGMVLAASFFFCGYLLFDHDGKIGVMSTISEMYLIHEPESSDFGFLPQADTEEEDKDMGKKIAITFDDGPNPTYTKMLLEGLRERNVKATFFLLGSAAEKYPELVKQMQKDGHLIGNHTYHHVSLENADVVLINQEVVKTNEIIEKLTGQAPQYIRPPFGQRRDNLEELTGMVCVLWTIDPMDWCCEDAAAIERRIEENAADHAIILLHDEYKSSVMAALTAIDNLRKKGYEFVTVDEILFE